MVKMLFISIFMMLFLLDACAQEISVTPSPTPSGGIEGLVSEGPMCPGPVQIGNNTCPDEPYQATIMILDTSNKPITQFQTDISGYFKIALAPGYYILHPLSDKTMPHASDQSVLVSADQFSQVTIVYDTGMR